MRGTCSTSTRWSRGSACCATSMARIISVATSSAVAAGGAFFSRAAMFSCIREAYCSITAATSASLPGKYW